MKLALTLLGSWLAPALVTQVSAPSDPWGVLAAYGAAAPFALLCLWMLNRKDKEIATLQAEVANVTAAGMGQVVPALVRSTETVAEAAKALDAAATMMHMIAARGVSPEEIARFTRVLRAVETRLADGSS